MKTKSYYTLLILEAGKWYIHFGDYDKEVVEDEKADVKDSDPKAKLKIIRTADAQAAIDAAVADLNK
jgi:hypothetical protein